MNPADSMGGGNMGGDAAPRPILGHAVAVYDPTNGRVVHLHHVVILEGGRRVEREEAEATAGKLARAAGHDIGRLRVQFLDSPIPEDNRLFRIDPASGRIISG